MYSYQILKIGQSRGRFCPRFRHGICQKFGPSENQSNEMYSYQILKFVTWHFNHILEVEQYNFFSYDNYKMPMVGVKMHQCNNCIFLTEIRAPALSFGVPIARASIAALPGPRLPFCLTQGAPSGPNDFIDLHLEQMQSRKGYISSIFLFAARDFFLPACCGLNFDPTDLPNS